MVEFDRSIWECQDCERSFKTLRSEGKAASVADRKSFNDNKLKITTWLDKVALLSPYTLNKVFGEICYHHFHDGAAVNAANHYVQSPARVDAERSRQGTYGAPWVERALTVAQWKDSQDRDGNIVQKSLWKFLGEEVDVVKLKVASQTPKLTVSDAIRVSCLDLAGQGFLWAGAQADAGIKDVKPIDTFPHLLISQRALAVNWGIPTKPLTGHS